MINEQSVAAAGVQITHTPHTHSQIKRPIGFRSSLSMVPVYFDSISFFGGAAAATT